MTWYRARPGSGPALALTATLVWIAASASSCWSAQDDDPQVDAMGIELTHAELDEENSAVVALLDARGALQCTGTLITPGAVLTAAHCLLGAGIASVAVGTLAAAPDWALSVADQLLHPDFDGENLRFDVGVIELAGSAEGVLPARIAAAGSLARAESVVVVGYGRTSAEPGRASAGGIRRRGESKLVEIDATSFEIAPSPSQPCIGDSGGPVFERTADASLALLGVTSHGDLACMTHATVTRADSVSEFLAPWLASPEASAAPQCAVRDLRGGSPGAGALALIGSWAFLVWRRLTRSRS